MQLRSWCKEVWHEGKGYSADFTDHMGRVIKELEADPEQKVVLKAETDIVCENCPNNEGGVCTTQEKVRRYDEDVLRACGLSDVSEPCNQLPALGKCLGIILTLHVFLHLKAGYRIIQFRLYFFRPVKEVKNIICQMIRTLFLINKADWHLLKAFRIRVKCIVFNELPVILKNIYYNETGKFISVNFIFFRDNLDYAVKKSGNVLKCTGLPVTQSTLLDVQKNCNHNVVLEADSQITTYKKLIEEKENDSEDAETVARLKYSCQLKAKSESEALSQSIDPVLRNLWYFSQWY